MYNCTDCTYTSDRKNNLLSHTTRKHNRPLNSKEKEVVIVIPIVEEVDELKCTRCDKKFINKYTFNRHTNVCKGVSNILECHFCHKVYSSIQSKSNHIKNCKVKKQQLKEKEEEEEEALIEVLPIVKTKKKKTLPQILRQTVWDKWIGEDFGTSKCWCCKKNQIRQMNFDCGHVVSEYAGGEAILANFRPICRICNLSMQTENMIEFMERLKLRDNIRIVWENIELNRSCF